MFELGKPMFSSFDPLRPQASMRRNEMCWCRSGRKWKHCHALRQSEPALPRAALATKFYQIASDTALCYHPSAPDECSHGIIRAHTIQKRSGLDVIAEEGHVLSARDGRSGVLAKDLELIGINKASTFRGFCSKHDTVTFQKAENIRTFDVRVAYLLCYRALCFEAYMKMVALKTLDFFRDVIDRGSDFEGQVESQDSLSRFIYTTQLGKFEHERLKLIWDRYLDNYGGANFQWYAIQFDGLIPLVTSGTFFPERDFSGAALQPITAPVGALGLLGFNILPIAGKTCAIFGWLDNKPQNLNFVKSLHNIPPDLLASSIVQFSFDTSDNLFVRPSWWQQLPLQQRQFLLQVLRSSTPGRKTANGLVPQVPPILTLPVRSIRSGISSDLNQ